MSPWTKRRVVELPHELLHHIFSIAREPWWSDAWGREHNPILGLRDRLRCQAVCKAWRDALASSSLPLICELRAGDPGWLKKVEWVCRTQPTVSSIVIDCIQLGDLQDPAAQAALFALLSVQPRKALRYLGLRLASPVMRCLRTAPSQFPQLTKLSLSGDTGECWPLDAVVVRGLPNLQQLSTQDWGQVSLISGGAVLLPHLTSLEVHETRQLELDAALPALQQLLAWDFGEARLCGEQLQLPALTQLRFFQFGNFHSEEVELRFSAMPALQQLRLWGGDSYTATDPQELSALTHLTLLKANNFLYDPAEDVARWLEWAPPFLCKLCMNTTSADVLLKGVATRLASITCVKMNQPFQVRHLSGLRRLRQLQLSDYTPEELEREDLQCLSGLTSLQLLHFSRCDHEQDVGWRQMKKVRRALPSVCKVEFGYLPKACKVEFG